MFNRVYVPIDNSDISEHVLNKAIELVKSSSSAKLKIAHVVNLEQMTFGIEMIGANELKDDILSIAKKFIEHIKESLKNKNVQAEIVLLENYGAGLSDLLLEDAKAWDADLFMIGSHNLGSFTHLIAGGVAEDISHDASIPILLIPKRK